MLSWSTAYMWNFFFSCSDGDNKQTKIEMTDERDKFWFFNFLGKFVSLYQEKPRDETDSKYKSIFWIKICTSLFHQRNNPKAHGGTVLSMNRL